MGLKANWTGRKAYTTHLAGNRLSDQQQHEQAAKKHAEAAALYKEAFEGGCNDVNYLMAYSVLLLRMREFEQSREYLLKADKVKGVDKNHKRQIRQNYAICQWKLGNLDRAIELMQGLATEGKTSMIYGSLGFMLIEKARQTGDFDEALAFNLEALDYDDEDAVVLDNLGQLYLSMGDREKALEHFKKAHEFKPMQVDTLYFLGKIFHEQGEDEKAKKLLARALRGNYTALCTTSREQAQALYDEIGGEDPADVDDED